MADIYNSKPGTLIKSKTKQPTFLTIEGMKTGLKFIITNFKLDRSQEVQHQRTLSQDIYSYSFGESVGRIQVGGILFFGSCNGVSAASISEVNKYYSQNNITTKAKTVMVTIGSDNSFPCYLENISIIAEASEYNIGSFNLGFSVIPEASKGDGKSKSGSKLGPLGTNSSLGGSSIQGNTSLGISTGI